jgi:hypothetical protein
MINIVLTVPHAVCNPRTPRSQHTCDYSAPDAAFFVKEELERLLPRGKAHVVVIEASLNRRVVDMNRPKGHNLPERREVIKYKPDFVLDVHSFGREDSEEMADCDVVLMDIEPIQKGVTIPLLKKIHKSVVVGFLYGSKVNDIIKEMRDLSISCVLAEFKEQEPKKLRSAAKSVAQAIISILF